MATITMTEFARLFKKYRLRAEFETFSSFGDALAEKGYYYEESIFSHWQKGKRTPTNRQLVLKIIEIFSERESIRTIEEANEFLASVGLGYLTDKERENLSFEAIASVPFQVPNEIAHFTGRKELITKIQKEILGGKIVLLHGSPGIGKTALAIRMGHVLRNKFPDGVLWYKVDSSNIMDILLSIAHLFGEDISEIKDSEVRASIIRTLLAKKKVLLIFDNVTSEDKLHLLLPSSSSCSVILSSQESVLPLDNHYRALPVQLFNQEEVLALFQKVFDKKYVTVNKKPILTLGEKVGNLPLAINIAATHIKQFKLTLQEYTKQLSEESFDLHTLKYEDKSLLQTVNIGYDALDSQTQLVFSSLGVFEGKDFSLEAVAFVNKLSIRKTEAILQQLLDISFLERSKIGRYRTHPLLKLFAREQIQDNSIYLRAAVYYEQLLVSAQEKKSYRTLMQEVDNVIFVFKKCYEYEYWDQLVTLWNPVEKFLSDTNEVKKLRSLMETIDTAPRINNLQKALTVFLLLMLAFWSTLQIMGLKTTIWNYLYSFFITFTPIVGGIGIFQSKSWGLFKTNIGKAIFFTSAGCVTWAIGNIIWAYYNFVEKISLPYPSWSDAGFAPAYFFWIAGIIYLARATGAKFELKQKRSKIFLLLIPFIITVSSYYFLLFVVKRSFDSGAPFRTFLDLYYFSMDIIILTLATIVFGLSINFFGGRYKLSLFSILAGFIFMYISDFAFSYITTTQVYYNGGPSDLLFTFAFYLLSWGTLNFYRTPKRKV